MVKDADGIWSVTLGPLEPEIYEYSFQIGGAKVMDTGNKLLKTGLFPANLAVNRRTKRVQLMRTALSSLT
jgi:hypothetical protein